MTEVHYQIFANAASMLELDTTKLAILEVLGYPKGPSLLMVSYSARCNFSTMNCYSSVETIASQT